MEEQKKSPTSQEVHPPITMGPMGRRMGGGGRMGQPVEKPKNFKETMLRLWKYFGKENKLFAVIFIFVLISAGIGLTVPFLIGRAVDAMSINNKVNLGLLGVITLILLCIYLTDMIITFVQGWLMAGVSQRIVENLRATLFAKLQKLSIPFFDKRSNGDLMSRLTNDIDNISTTISQSTTQLMSNVIMILGSFVMMCILSPLLTLASVITIPLVFTLTRTIASRTKVLFKEQQTALGKLNGLIEETISGIHVVKAFNHEDMAILDFDNTNQMLCNIGIKANVLSGYLMPIMNVINNIGFASVAGFGGLLAVNNLITVGIIASFLSYSRQFSRPLNDIANIFNTLQTAVAGAERVFRSAARWQPPGRRRSARRRCFR